jgi:hypothetical protein
MISTLRQVVKIGAGGTIRIQSDQFQEGQIADVLVTTAHSEPVESPSRSWEQFIGVGVKSGRTEREIDASIRELRDEWPQ